MRNGPILTQLQKLKGGVGAVATAIGQARSAGKRPDPVEQRQAIEAALSKLSEPIFGHCITRPDNTGPAMGKDGFINRYVFPDGELEGSGYLISLMHDTGFEVRHERTCASTTPRPWPPGAPTSTRTGTRRSPRSARARPACGACTWRAHGSASTAPNRAALGPGRAAARGRNLWHSAAAQLGNPAGPRQLTFRTDSGSPLAPQRTSCGRWPLACTDQLRRLESRQFRGHFHYAAFGAQLSNWRS